MINLVVFFLSSSLCMKAAGANLVADQSAEVRQNVTSVFNEAQPANGATVGSIKSLTTDSLKKSWFKAPVTKNSGMFNPVFLPFSVYLEGGTYDFGQALTFPSLLSFKFDFVPDNFSARHPGFIYRKNPVWNVKPGQTEKIAEYVEYWEATHAFAGTVFQHADGYSGEMIVYDRTGSEILSEKYETHVPYFTLMGLMVKTWMDFCRQPVSDGLYKELVRPMTKDMECVSLYAESFSKKWRTQEEWDLYEQILQRDPNFGEVRHWYANQKSWATDDHVTLQIEKGRALMDHLVMPALLEFVPSRCSDKQVVQNYYDRLAYAKSICDDNCVVSYLNLKVGGSKLSDRELDSYLKTAERYPCYSPLIEKLADQFRRRGIYEKSTPLYISSIRSGYMPGTGSYEWQWTALQEDFDKLGYYAESIFCGLNAIRHKPDENKNIIYWYLGSAYREQFHFENAAEIFNMISSDEQGTLLCDLSIYEGGNLELLRRLQKTDKTANYLGQTRRLLAQGRYDEALKELADMREYFESNRLYHDLHIELLSADACLLSGDLENARKYALHAWYIAPRSRLVNWLIRKAYEGDETVLGRYAAVESFIYEGSALRESPVAIIEMPLSFSGQNLVARFREIQSKLAQTDEKTGFDFWMQFTPFEIEYVCLGLLKNDASVSLQEVLSLYRDYTARIQSVSEYQKRHLRIFHIQLSELGK